MCTEVRFAQEKMTFKMMQNRHFSNVGKRLKKISWLTVEKIILGVPSFSTKKSACGNVPGPKTQFSTKKKRLRQRTRTKNAIFHQKKAPAATCQDQKRIFFKKEEKRKAPAATYQDQKLFFQGHNSKNRFFSRLFFKTLSHLAFEERGGTFINRL